MSALLLPMRSDESNHRPPAPGIQDRLSATATSFLDHYLPETYQYLMEAMDTQQVLLKHLQVQEQFALIDSSNESLGPCGAL